MTTTSYPALQSIFQTYEAVIGLEVHCQLATKSKIFSSSSTTYGEQPNANIDPTCLGLPGALPVLNEECVNLALRMAIATHCEIQPISIFTRKNYFYPDLPKGYQITQLDHPLCLNGHVTLESGKPIGIDRIQLEEDAGKNIHIGNSSLVDYNRAGFGLIEIVSKPDISTPEEATEYLKKIHHFAVNLGVSEGNMEQGNFRCDANISLRPRNSQKYGTRAEVKNVNSFKYLEKAIAYEIERQFKVLTAGEKVAFETRGFDSENNVTFSQRNKETADGYRFFPEPDLPPLIVTQQRIADVKNSLPELPEEVAKRYQEKYHLPSYDAQVISAKVMNRSYFEDLVHALQGQLEPKAISNFFMTEILRSVKVKAEQKNISIDDINEIPIKLTHSIELLELVAKEVISGRIAKDVFEEMLISDESPQKIVSTKGWTQVQDIGEVSAAIQRVLDENTNQLAEYLSGKEKLFGYFVGQAMKITGGKLNPAKVNDLLKEALEKRRS